MKAVEKFEYRRGYKFPPTRHGGSAGDHTIDRDQARTIPDSRSHD